MRTTPSVLTWNGRQGLAEDLPDAGYRNIFAVGIAFVIPHLISNLMQSANGTPILTSSHGAKNRHAFCRHGESRCHEYCEHAERC